jgi:hypothetical protein
MFDPSFDWTKNIHDNSMADLYTNALSRWAGKSQWEVFSEVTKGCRNIVVIKGDSKTVELPPFKLCFGFIDGHHDPEYVRNDFNLLWNRLSPGGCIAFHDYGADLPQTTAEIDAIVCEHSGEIEATHHDRTKWILFVIRSRTSNAG